MICMIESVPVNVSSWSDVDLLLIVFHESLNVTFTKKQT